MCGLVSPPLTLMSIDGSMEKVMVSSVHCRYMYISGTYEIYTKVSIEDFILSGHSYIDVIISPLLTCNCSPLCASAVISLYPLELKVHTISSQSLT